jgi:putative SOS response-associated peptidase YedK
MCAKYGSASEYNLFERAYKISFPQVVMLPQQIIYPHAPAPVIVSHDGRPELELMSYSLIPSWSKVRKPKFTTYNARIEDIRSKPTWKEPFKSKHCLVPVVHFLESVYKGSFEGHNISIFAKDHHLLTAAGVWDSWFDQKTGEEVHSFAIITTEPPQDILEAGHDRCPVFLSQESRFDWIHSKMKPDDGYDYLLSSQEEVKWDFEKLDKLKGYTGQLSLIDDE